MSGVDRPMTRRDALRAGALLAGGAALASLGTIGACARGGEREDSARAAGSAAAGSGSRGVLSADDEALMGEVADTILPDTPASPGAKAAGATAAIQLLLTDCYDAAAQQRIVHGLADLRARSARAGGAFAALPRASREKILRDLDAEATPAAIPPGASRSATPPHWFATARDVAERAYWSSETGMTKALRYVRIPGHFTGCMPLAKGQPAWG